MILTINIPEKDIPKMQSIINISLHFLSGQLVEYTAPSGWNIESKLDYGLFKKSTKEPLLPCICGTNSRSTWYDTRLKKFLYFCNGCGRKVYGKNKADLRRNWNAEIKSDKTESEEVKDE